MYNQACFKIRESCLAKCKKNGGNMVDLNRAKEPAKNAYLLPM